jgi:hypothetical protein
LSDGHLAGPGVTFVKNRTMLASDADRDRVVQALKEAYVDGRLTHEELDQRLTAAIRARTLDDTRRLLADVQPRPLPGVMPAYRAWPVRYFAWWPALLCGVLFLAFGTGGHGVGFAWWFIFPAFFWFRGGWLRGGRRHYHRGPYF